MSARSKDNEYVGHGKIKEALLPQNGGPHVNTKGRTASLAKIEVQNTIYGDVIIKFNRNDYKIIYINGHLYQIGILT